MMNACPEIEQFNIMIWEYMMSLKSKVKEAIQGNVNCYQIDWNNTSPESNSVNISQLYLDYYWMEFIYHGKEYKVSMFYKDFDHSTGNIHILPGPLQFWEKKDSGKISEREKKLYLNQRTIRPYVENNWVPIFQQPVFWQENIKPLSANCLLKVIEDKNIDIRCEINSTQFYQPIIGFYKNFLSNLPESSQPNIRTGHGHYKNYSLMKWLETSDKIVTYYHIMDFGEHGFFAKYGEAHTYPLFHAKGPNLFENANWNLSYEKTSGANKVIQIN